MTEQLMEIGERLRALRNIMDISAGTMAERMNLDIAEYMAYEQGDRDFSFSFLFNAAGILGVDIVDIISGDTPRLTTCSLIRRGEGYHIVRQQAYDYRHLAFTFAGKKAEPFMVTVEPSGDEEVNPHSHNGQEFNYMVSGSLEFYLDNMMYVLEEGDSVYFDSGISHAMRARSGQPAQFIAVVIK